MKHSLKQWIFFTRPWSFPASIMPAIIAVSFVYHQYKYNLIANVNWFNGILAIIGVIIFHSSGNIISDYYDFVNKVDRKESYGSNRLIIDGVFDAKVARNFGFVMLAIGCVIGLYICFNSGYYLLLIGFVGVVASMFYYKFKYRALGDLLIFIVFGLLVAFGTYYVMTNVLSWEILLISTPVGLLITAILHANNTRDMLHDNQAGIKTSAMLLGVKGSKIKYSLLTILCYLTVVALILVKILPYTCLFVFLTLPLAIKNMQIMSRFSNDNNLKIMNLDAKTAQLVLVFAIILSLSNVIS